MACTINDPKCVPSLEFVADGMVCHHINIEFYIGYECPDGTLGIMNPQTLETYEWTGTKEDLISHTDGSKFCKVDQLPDSPIYDFQLNSID